MNEVWREQTLNRLLNLVELPLLEGVLQYNQGPPTPPRSTVPAHRNPDLIFSSNHLDRQILEAFKDSQWVELKISLKRATCKIHHSLCYVPWTRSGHIFKLMIRWPSENVVYRKAKKKKNGEKYQGRHPSTSSSDAILYIAPLMWSLREDEWLCAALDCLDFLPDQLVVDLSRELSRCFQQDQDGCEQLPVGQKSQGEGKCHAAHQSCRLRSGALCCSKRSSVAVILTFSFSEGHLLHCCTAFLYKCLSLKETSYFIPLLYSRQHCNMNLKK